MKWVFKREWLVDFINIATSLPESWSPEMMERLREVKRHFDSYPMDELFEVEFSPAEKEEIVRVLGLEELEKEMRRKPN